MRNDKLVCVIGLGYVGLTLSVAMAKCGFKIVGVEKQKDIVEQIKAGRSHFYEPKLEGMLTEFINSGDMSVHTSIPFDVDPDIYIITVGTPLDENSSVKMDMIISAIESVAENAKEDVIVIMRSTSKLGTTRNVVKPILDRSGIKYDLAFCPERTIEGKALEELTYLPQVIGGINPQSTTRASNIFQQLTSKVVPVSDVETAEMVKMIDNTQRDVLFAFSNEIVDFCGSVGISGVEVIQAGRDGYIRNNLPLPGPVGGPCLTKDTHILAEGLREAGVVPNIAVTARELNERLPNSAVLQLSKLLDESYTISNITLCGLAFKGRPPTDDLRGTMAEPIFNAIQKHFPDASYRGFDTMVNADNIKKFGLIPSSTLEDAFKDTDILFILNNHHVFEEMDINALSSLMNKPGIIFDFWNIFNSDSLLLSNKINYIGFGSKAYSNL